MNANQVNFPINVYLLAFTGAAAAALVTLPIWRAICHRFGLLDDPGDRKIHHSPIPLAGGLAVFTAMLLPLIGGVILMRFALLDSSTAAPLEYGVSRRAWQLGAIFAGAFGMLLLGLLDDKYELRPAVKFGGQVLIAVLVAAAGVRVTLFVPSAVFSYVITVLWILTVTNAFNFMDNMNGLCAGLGAIAACYFGLSAAAAGQYLVALLAFLATGALLGFLPHNFPKATAFLGDAGSHLVGYLAAVLAILPHFYTPERPKTLAVLTPLFLLAVPLADLVWVVILRWKTGKPFYVGDTNHLSHRLTRRGLNQRQTVLLIWLIAAIVGAVPFINW